ncbi:MAG: fimbrillin family protein [Bacteroidales bacterium]|jgi:hypothetical protein
MKKILLLVAIASLGFASCTNENVDENSQQKGINFKTMVGKNSLNKVGEMITADFDHFHVSAYRTSEGPMSYTSTLVPYINNLAVYRSGADWIYTGAYYWPNQDTLQFFAHNANGASDMPTTTIVGYPYFTTSISSTSATQQDILVAKTINKSALGTTPVSMTFLHALTQVNFSLKGAEIGPNYIIKKIEMIGAKDHGTFTFNDTMRYCWSNQTGNATYTYFNGSKTILTTLTSFGNGSRVASGDLTGYEALMIMPQNGDWITIKVTYDLVNAGVTLYSDAEASVVLTGEHMNVGKKVRYNLTVPTPTGVSTSKITFTATVSDWDPEVAGTQTTLN